MIAIDLSTKQALDADPREIQHINFRANLDTGGNTWRSKRNCFGLFTRNRKRFVNAIPLNSVLLNTKYRLIFISIKLHNTIV